LFLSREPQLLGLALFLFVRYTSPSLSSEKFMFKHILVAALAVGVIGSANAAGCLKGAAIGAVVGHEAGHHAVMGAVGGCIVGHHVAKEKAKQQAAAAQQAQQAQYAARTQ
jgi:hypothetical protein